MSAECSMQAGVRRAAYSFTGCLAHADVTYQINEAGGQVQAVRRVIAYLQHNEACIKAELVRAPSVPLHDHVLEVALRQLRNGAGYV